jgi:hypothetical protein
VGAGVCPIGVGEGVCPIGVGAGVITAVAIGLGVTACVSGGAVGVGVGTAQDSKPTWFVSIVTAPFRANALPATDALVVRLMLVRARILPVKVVPVPRVAELPTCQKTLQSFPPLITCTDETLAVVNVLPIWKMKTAAALPCAFSVKAPVSWAELEKQ